MSFISLSSQLERSKSTFELADRLGRACLKGGWRMRRLAERPEVTAPVEELEALVERLDPELLTDPDSKTGFAAVMEIPEVRASIRLLEAHNPIEHLAFLRGMLPRLREIYDDFEGTLEAHFGTPLPIAERGVNQIFRPTPRAETCGINDLLHGSSFYLFEFGASESVPVVLDFRFRDRLDALTWATENRLPKIATVHPRVGKDGILVEEQNGSYFFGARPREFDADAVLGQLREVAGKAPIAVLPELSLSQADALEVALGEAPGSYPPIVVAGSAHVKEVAAATNDGLEVRANECRIYLDGSRIATHRKIHPYELRRAPDGSKVAQPLTEGITSERKPLTILASEFTRLGVVICADALDRNLHAPLADAQVNLLLVPALTSDAGGFSGTIGGLASRCQGVSVIANVDTAFFTGSEDPPFTLIAAVPRGKIGDQSREFHSPQAFPALAVFDPNEPLDEAVEWHHPLEKVDKSSQFGDK